MQETQEMPVRSLGQKDPPEKEMATHSSLLAWEIPWAEGPGGLQSTESDTTEHARTHGEGLPHSPFDRLPLEGIWVVFQFLPIVNKSSMNIVYVFFVSINFRVSGINARECSCSAVW